ncbi:hypothetical protein GCM10010191_43680 [Actinomadura vinacea]|uniref:Conjugal transfer protein n=2 Tax=Actinomadura vinacea TaxID=115336 RepID=A0ABN3JDZ9_9ACTN
MTECAQATLVSVSVVLAGSIALAVLAPTDAPVPPLPAADRERAAEVATRQLLTLSTADLGDPGERQRIDTAVTTGYLRGRLFENAPLSQPRERLSAARVSTLVVTGSRRTDQPWVTLMAVVRGRAKGVDAMRRYDVVMILTSQGWRMGSLHPTSGSQVVLLEARALRGEPTEEYRFIEKAEEVMGAVIGAPRSKAAGPDLSRLTGAAPRQYAQILAREKRTSAPDGDSTRRPEIILRDGTLVRQGRMSLSYSSSVRRSGIIRRDDRSAELLMFVNLGDITGSPGSALALRVTFVRVGGAWKISGLADA